MFVIVFNFGDIPNKNMKPCPLLFTFFLLFFYLGMHVCMGMRKEEAHICGCLQSLKDSVDSPGVGNN